MIQSKEPYADASTVPSNKGATNELVQVSDTLLHFHFIKDE